LSYPGVAPLPGAKAPALAFGSLRSALHRGDTLKGFSPPWRSAVTPLP